MKNILIPIVSLFLSGCAMTAFPDFPETVSNHYVIDVKDEPVSAGLYASIINVDEIPAAHTVARCLKFLIVAKVPYRIKFLSEVELKECSGVGGYKPDDAVSIYNWMNDVVAWSESRKKCFK